MGGLDCSLMWFKGFRLQYYWTGCKYFKGWFVGLFGHLYCSSKLKLELKLIPTPIRLTITTVPAVLRRSGGTCRSHDSGHMSADQTELRPKPFLTSHLFFRILPAFFFSFLFKLLFNIKVLLPSSACAGHKVT